MRSFPALARVLIAWAVGASTVACRSQGGAIPDGMWTGDLHAPERPAAIGFLARVGTAPTTLEIIALEAMGFSGGTVAGLRTSSGALQFTWSSEDDRSCDLTRDSTGTYAGDCTSPGESTWRVRLAPPANRAAPSGHAHSMLARTDRRWQTRTFPWGRLHIASDAPDTLDPQARGAELAAAIAGGVEMLGASAYDRPLDAFLLADREEIRALSGQNAASTADPYGSTVLLARYGSMPGVMRHEVMHVLSINLWGVPPEPAAWAREGIATFAAGKCRGYGLHQLAASFAASGELLPLRALLDEFYQHSDLVTYLQSASLFQYLYERRGPAYARDVWRLGLEPALRRDGSTLDALEAEWRASLRVPSLHPEAVDWSRIKNGKGCG